MVRAYLKYPNENGRFQWYPFDDIKGKAFKFESDREARDQLERIGFLLCIRGVGPYNFRTAPAV